MLKKLLLAVVVCGAVILGGCCNKDGCGLVYEDGSPAPCCKTVTNFSH